MPQNSFENDEDELKNLARAERLFGVLAELQRRLDAVTPVDGGVLAREDANTAYDPLSNQVHHQLAIAFDHLETLSRHCQTHGLPMSSGYTLMRTAIETTATAIWLLAPNRSDKRIIQALRLIWWSRQDADQLSSSLGFDRTAGTKRLLARLTQLRDIRPANRQRRLELAPIATTALIIEADRALDRDIETMNLLTTWRMCSGMAHGNKAVSLMLLERRKIQGPRNNTYLMTSSWGLTTLALTVAVAGLKTAVERFEHHAARAT